MKCVAFLAFIAFNARFLPNRVEAGKCYACDPSKLTNWPDCKDFLTASDSEKETRFIKKEKEGIFDDCSRCSTIFHDLTKLVAIRDCAKLGDELGTRPAPFGNDGTEEVCEGDLCNGNTQAKCFACGFGRFGSCEEFELSTDEERNKSKFVNYFFTYIRKYEEPVDLPCEKCQTVLKGGNVVKRDCASKFEAVGTKKKDGGKVKVCKGDLCNGEKSSGSKSGAGSFWSLATVAAVSLLN